MWLSGSKPAADSISKLEKWDSSFYCTLVQVKDSTYPDKYLDIYKMVCIFMVWDWHLEFECNVIMNCFEFGDPLTFHQNLHCTNTLVWEHSWSADNQVLYCCYNITTMMNMVNIIQAYIGRLALSPWEWWSVDLAKTLLCQSPASQFASMAGCKLLVLM